MRETLDILRRLLKSGDVTLDVLGFGSSEWKDFKSDDGIAAILLSSEFHDCGSAERLGEIQNAISLLKLLEAAKVRTDSFYVVYFNICTQELSIFSIYDIIHRVLNCVDLSGEIYLGYRSCKRTT